MCWKANVVLWVAHVQHEDFMMKLKFQFIFLAHKGLQDHLALLFFQST